MKSLGKSHIFRDKLWKLSVKVWAVLRTRPIETRNQNLRPLPDFFGHHESSNGLIIGKQVSVENHIFWGKHYCFSLREISISWHPKILFWKLSIPLDLCWLVEFNFKLQLLFWLTSKKLTFWMILPQGLKYGTEAQKQLWTHIEYDWAHIRGRNSNIQFFMGFDYVWVLFLILQKNVKFKNTIFILKYILMRSRWQTYFKMFYELIGIL